jgi:hypothetical protein
MAFVAPIVAAGASALGSIGGTTLLGVASLGATAVGGLMQANAAKAQARSQAAASAYQAQIARNNALYAQQNATYTREKGAADAEINDRRVRAAVGAEVAQQGASGFDVNSGSPLDLRASTASLGRYDTLNIKNNAELNARAYDIEAKGQTANANLLQAQSASQKKAGTISYLSSLIGTASSVSSKWMDYQKSGVFG